MQEALSELIEILEAQRDSQAALVALSEKKTKAITKGDAIGLQAIVDEERITLARLKGVDRRQSQCAAKLSARLGVQPSEVRMTLVVGHAQGEQKARLEALRAEICDLVEKQAQHNKVNMMLLRMNMDYAQFLINATSRQQAGPTYGNGGVMQKTVGHSRSLLDRKV